MPRTMTVVEFRGTEGLDYRAMLRCAVLGAAARNGIPTPTTASRVPIIQSIERQRQH